MLREQCFKTRLQTKKRAPHKEQLRKKQMIKLFFKTLFRLSWRLFQSIFDRNRAIEFGLHVSNQDDGIKPNK